MAFTYLARGDLKMPVRRFQLFGKFSAYRDAELVRGLDAGKEQELLSYLLVRRDRCHPREALATLLWGDTSTERSKKYLRQALWHVQSILEDGSPQGTPLLLIGHDWVQLNLQSDLWLDVASFEQAYAATRGVPGHLLDSSRSGLLKNALELYKGDLMEGSYQDWCLFERERLQNIYLSMLEKLMIYSERHGQYEAGLGYGSTILQFDRARESTHRHLMHLHYLAGDRTSALRQYERCTRGLIEELGVKPQKRTSALYEQIRADRLVEVAPSANHAGTEAASALNDALSHLKRFQVVLSAIQNRLQRDINAVEQRVSSRKE